MKVAIVTSDIMGPIKNGGVGTACYALAETLAQTGMEVTVCYAAWADEHLENFVQWQKFYYSKNIRLLAVPRPAIELEFAGPSSAAYAVYQFLRREIDQYGWEVIHFPDMHGLAYYALQAKKTMGLFEKTRLCVTLHGPGYWHKDHQSSITSLDELENKFLEQKVVENCDVLFAPTNYILDWARDAGYKLPPSIVVEANIVPGDILPESKKMQTSAVIDEIVFFGRLESRKGLDLFVDAIKELDLEGKRVVFLGKNGMVQNLDGRQYIEKYLEGTNIDFEIISDLGAKDALSFLAKGNRLAVIPSKSESMGYTLLECIECQIPFIASKIPSFLELTKEENHQESFFDLNSTSLAEKIKKVLNEGASIAERKRSNEEAKKTWILWHKNLFFPKTERLPESYPRVSVCIPHRNRQLFLKTCLKSLGDQKYPNLEILIGDDASDETPTIDDPSVKLFCFKEQKGPAFVRNRLAEIATGEFLLFMDDDNITRLEEINIFVNAFKRTGADILTCAFDRVTESKLGYLKTQSRWVPLGNAPAVGFFFNAFGDTNSFFRREIFLQLGGFNETKELIGEDWDLFIRASMAGYSIEVIPEAFIWYREHTGNYSKRTNKNLSHQILLNTYLNKIPQSILKELFWFLNGVALGLPRENSFCKWSGNLSEEIYKDPFDIKKQYPRSLFQLSALDFEKKAQLTLDLQSKIENEKIILISDGLDPQFEFESLDFNGRPILLEAEITSPLETEFTVFYQTLSQPSYGINQSITLTLRPGNNFLQIPLKDRITGKLRVDPASASGEFVLKQLRILSEI